MSETYFTLNLSWQEYDALEEAADLMAMSGELYVNTFAEAVHWLALKYIQEVGPDFEVAWDENGEEDELLKKAETKMLFLAKPHREP